MGVSIGKRPETQKRGFSYFIHYSVIADALVRMAPQMLHFALICLLVSAEIDGQLTNVKENDVKNAGVSPFLMKVTNCY